MDIAFSLDKRGEGQQTVGGNFRVAEGVLGGEVCCERATGFTCGSAGFRKALGKGPTIKVGE